MLLVMQVSAHLLVCSAVLVRRCHWSPLTVVLVLLVLCPMIRVLVHCLMGDFLHQICGYRVIQFQGMASLFWCCVQVRANGLCIL
jgi:hypothetical protein